MTGMEIAGVALGVVGTGLQASSQVMAGRESARAAQFEAAQYEAQRRQLEIEEQTYRTAAAQNEARRTEELTSNLETIQAIRAGRGVGMASPTGNAILSSASQDARRDIGIETTNILEKADASRRSASLSGAAAEQSRRKAKYSIFAGNLGAATTLVTGLSRLGRSYV